MIDREKMTKGLECCIIHVNCGANGGCPYKTGVDEQGLETLMKDAFTLLQAERPRLLQAADFQRADADDGGAIPCWKEPKSPTRRRGWAVIVYGKWLADSGLVRYWTGKPTDEQMEETPWM